MLDAAGVEWMAGDEEAGASAAARECDGPGSGALALCGRPVYAKGKCQSHYRQVLAKEPLRPLQPRRAIVPGGSVRRYGLRWPNVELLHQVEDLALAEGSSVEDLVVTLVGERLEQLAMAKGGKKS